MNATVSFERSTRRLVYLFTGFWLPAFISVSLNSFILVVTLHKTAVSGRYKIFIGYLAISDLLASGSICLLQPFVVLSEPENYWSWMCDAGGTFFWVASQTMILALSLSAYNRYVSVCKGQTTYNQRFTQTKIAIMVTVTMVFSILTGSVFWLDTLYYGDHTLPIKVTMCNAYIKVNSQLVHAGTIIGGNVTLLSLAVTAYFVVRTRRHITEVSNQVVEVAGEARIKRNKNIVKALTIQLTLALLAIFPSAIVAATLPLFEDQSDRFDLQEMAQLILALNPGFDAIATLLVVKPYRRVMINFVKQAYKGEIILKDPNTTHAPNKQAQGQGKTNQAKY